MTSGALSALMDHARAAALRARAPYSKFRVGAAVQSEGGDVIVGCNVESASYGLSCCAERVALFTCVAAAQNPVRLAVSCLDAPLDAAASAKTPCGACRQVILDIMGPDARVEIDGVGEFSAAELLPHGFVL